jgi:hypothetical protein
MRNYAGHHLHVKTNLLKQINRITSVKRLRQKNILLFRNRKSIIPAQHKGAFRDRHGRRARDAVDAGGAKDEGAARGRRSRVVLTPPGWRQVGGILSAGDGVKKT